MNRPHIARSLLAATLSIILFSGYAYCQVSPSEGKPADTSRSARAESLVVPVRAIPLVGSVDRHLDLSKVVADTAMVFTDYRYLGDLLNSASGVFIRDLGSPGQLNGITVQGIDGRGVAFLNDGIELNDPLTGVYDPFLYPTENIDRVEILDGTRAFLYGLNANGAAVNVVSRSMKAYHPYTHIRYSESSYGNGMFDGMFSQNVTRALNVSVGVQHLTLDGEYPNTDEDAWGVRTKIRYNLNDRLDFFASEIYNKTQTGLSGGLDTLTAYALAYNPIQDTMRNTDSYEKISRHDIQAGVAGEFFPESTAVTTLTFYRSTNKREYRDEENRPFPNGIFLQEDFWSQSYGAKLAQHLEFVGNLLDVGLEVQTRGIPSSIYLKQELETDRSLYAKDEIVVSDAVRGAVYSRFDSYLGYSKTGAGADVSFKPVSWTTLFGGYSRSYRFPTFQELYWRDSVVASAEPSFAPETHLLFEAGLRIGDGETGMEFRYFHRTVDDAIMTTPTDVPYPFRTFEFVRVDQMTYSGLTGSARIRAGAFLAEGNAQFLQISNGNGYETLLPKWTGTGGVYFWDKLAGNHLDLKVGIRGQFFSSYRGMEFNPQAWMYVPSRQPAVATTGVSDLVVIAHIGDAYIHIIWQNLLDLQYVFTPAYPEIERTVRFGVGWEFKD